MGVSLEPFTHVTEWLDRLAERPSVASEIDVVAALA
jgi:hypothetical protein